MRRNWRYSWSYATAGAHGLIQPQPNSWSFSLAGCGSFFPSCLCSDMNSFWPHLLTTVKKRLEPPTRGGACGQSPFLDGAWRFVERSLQHFCFSPHQPTRSRVAHGLRAHAQLGPSRHKRAGANNAPWPKTAIVGGAVSQLASNAEAASPAGLVIKVTPG